MQIIYSLLQIFIGVFCVWMGSFTLITAMVPHDVGMKFAEQHGAWIREHIFKLPPTEATNDR